MFAERVVSEHLCRDIEISVVSGAAVAALGKPALGSGRWRFG